MLKVEIKPATQLPNGVNVYADYYIGFKPVDPLPVNPPDNAIDPYLGIKAPQSFIMHIRDRISTVTVTIAAVNYSFYSVDTYAPLPSLQIVDSITLPAVRERGILLFRAEFPDDDMITMHQKKIEYRVSPDKSFVQLRFALAENVHYVRIANCLVAGIAEDDNLAEIWMENISWENQIQFSRNAVR